MKSYVGAMILLVMAGDFASAAIVSLPSDFSGIQGSNGIYYESIGDSRSTNTLHPGSGVSTMTFNPTFTFPGDIPRPTYRVPQSFPFIQNHIPGSYVLMHPGTGGANFGTGTSNLGSSIRFQASTDGWYNATGTFAWQNGLSGNGVDALVVRNDELDLPLFTRTIDIAPVPTDPFDGTAVAPFNLSVFLSAGESIRFIVFADAQGQNGTYDGTGLRLTITAVPEPSTCLLAAIGALGVLALRKKTEVSYS